MKFRLRFSVRTLAIVVTLACAYLAAWKATMKYGLSTPYEIRYITNATGGRFTVRGRQASLLRCRSSSDVTAIWTAISYVLGLSQHLAITCGFSVPKSRCTAIRTGKKFENDPP
jgi:hypothetical protein